MDNMPHDWMNRVLFRNVFTEEVSQNHVDCYEREVRKSVGFLLLALPHTYLRQEDSLPNKLSNDAKSQTKAELQSQRKEKVAAHQAPSHSSRKSPFQ